MSGIKPTSKKYLSFAVLFTCILMLLAACGNTSNGTTSTASPANCPHPISLSKVVLGVIPAESQTSIIGETQPFATALSKQICKPVSIFVGTSYTAVITAMLNGKADLASFGPLSYVLASQKGGARAISLELAPKTKESTYQSYIITTPKTGIKTIQDLKGKTFSFVDPASTSGNLEPRYMMRQAGLNADTDVKGSYIGSHDASLLAVLSGKADAGAVASDTYNQLLQEGKFKNGDLTIVAKSDPIPESPMAVRTNLSKSDATSLQQALVALNGNAGALNAIAIGGFTNCDDSLYNGIRTMAKVMNIDLQKVAG
ncbi:phosphate/phosphite/phosphonate ABC transporter substrate-binding protein [Dictyobacter formicarum]|uniref:Phosphonates-binding protein n=1 Tax=Dictyobacter formicarum TaxID=2778368 RepID=A0ABQ3VDT4_9CHLR|nr:phosphate/phosphite/phosphonate ABC transporter substrate-binding protein [Dictyobacter formicarum]GHO83904.1 phosphonates-binding protein [Dictyobacter formicarum]